MGTLRRFKIELYQHENSLIQDHWIGLLYWNNITLTKPQQLLIELEDWDGNKTQVAVNNFIIGTEFYKFRIIYGGIDGEFGESLPKKGTKFSTVDSDNDAWSKNCAARFAESVEIELL